jgi:hypothetical protein
VAYEIIVDIGFFINPQTLKIGIDQKKCFLIKLSVKPKE